jgi:hypothetical protein
MFLSRQVSHLELDGSLVVDLASMGGPKVRFAPLALGMDWSRWEGGRWVPTDHDYGVLLVNKAHESRQDLPILNYLAGVPEHVLGVLDRVRYVQASVLQIWARWPSAQDLLQNNFALLWILASEYVFSPDRRHLILDALNLPQRDLLSVILRQRVRQPQVRFLRRVVLDSGNRAALLNIRRFVADEDKVMQFRHWSKIPSGLVSLLFEAPYLATFHPLRADIDAASRLWEFKSVASERGRLLRDTIRLAELLQPEGFAARAMTRYRSWSRVEDLHDKMIRTAQVLGWEVLLDSDISVNQQLCKPPIPASEGFVPIETVGELIEESETMAHCVMIRARDAIDGLAAIYRVNVAGQRCTLEISIGDDMEPLAIEQFKLACNKDPSPEAWDAAERWFSGVRGMWARNIALGI